MRLRAVMLMIAFAVPALSGCGGSLTGVPTTSGVRFPLSIDVTGPTAPSDEPFELPYAVGHEFCLLIDTSFVSEELTEVAKPLPAGSWKVTRVDAERVFGELLLGAYDLKSLDGGANRAGVPALGLDTLSSDGRC